MAYSVLCDEYHVSLVSTRLNLDFIFYAIPYPTCTNVCRYTFAEDGSLHIQSAQVTDTGRYLCMATNQAGTQRKRVDLQIYGGWYDRYVRAKHINTFPITDKHSHPVIS